MSENWKSACSHIILLGFSKYTQIKNSSTISFKVYFFINERNYKYII